MVAASKLRRAQERIMSARPYAQQMQRVLASVASRVDPSIHPLLTSRERRPSSRTLVIVVTADKGLCGSFNTNVIKGAAGYITGSSEPCSLGLVGRKGRDFFGRRGFEVLFEQVGIFQKLRYRRCAGDRADGDRGVHRRAGRSRGAGLQRVQVGDDPARGRRSVAADRARGRRGGRRAPRRIRSTTCTSRRRRRSSTSCCRATSRCRSTGRCSNRTRRSSPRR